MADIRGDKSGNRDSLEKDKLPGKGSQPSRNREESMTESADDEQRSDSSGTTGLGGETPNGNPVRGPGGVEGTAGEG